MKRTLIASASLFLTLTLHAALIEYNYTGRETFTGAGTQVTYTYSGVMIYDIISSNVTFIDIRSDHTYHYGTHTNFHFTAVSAKNSTTTTVLNDCQSEIDSNGFYHLNSYMITGQNATLTISSNATYTFPKKFSGANNRALNANTSGTFQLETWGETMTYSPARTIPDNNQGLTATDVLNAIINEIQTKGILTTR